MDEINDLDIKNDAEFSLQMFDSGFNCAQAVLSTYAERFGIDELLALKIPCGFGAGMARLQETCGAVIGGTIVIGLAMNEKANRLEDILINKEHVYASIIDFTDRFKEKHHTIKCRELLNCDISTEEGKKEFEKNNLRLSICFKCIEDVITILQDFVLKKDSLNKV
jgi:C_GCAxxG_C_C family probable redox protein